MSVRPAISSSRRAFGSVSASGTLPDTGVMASTLSSGERRARKMAMASSTPGSVSRMMRRGVEGESANRNAAEPLAGRKESNRIWEKDEAIKAPPELSRNRRRDERKWSADIELLGWRYDRLEIGITKRDCIAKREEQKRKAEAGLLAVVENQAEARAACLASREPSLVMSRSAKPMP